MKVLVTGASGFLGRTVVVAGVEAGHEVTAMRRRASASPEIPGAKWIDGDLRQRGEWRHALSDVDAVIHLAAAASGDLGEQFAGTVTATENLLEALPDRGGPDLVHVSSFSVYDYEHLESGDELDENSALEPDPMGRDAYTTTKLLQERLVREACASSGRRLVVLRPGAIYGPGKDWDFGVALRVGRLGFVASPRARMRLVHVENCADAIVASLQIAQVDAATINLVDDEPPTHWEYFRACRSRGMVDLLPVPVPWRAVQGIGRLTETCAARLVGGTPKLPELVAPRKQAARWKPLTYPNRTAHELLGWEPRIGLEAGLDQMAEVVG